MAEAETPKPAPKHGLGLKVQLLITFCALAVVPALLVMVFQLRTSESYLVKTVATVAGLGRSALEESSTRIADTSLKTMTLTSDGLINLSTLAITKNSDTLMRVSHDKLEDASNQIIDLSQKTNQQVTSDLVTLSRKANESVGRDLIALSQDANRNLAASTAQAADKAVKANSERLIRINEKLAEELSTYLAKANREAAADVSKRLISELEREPLVNFRLLAQIIAQTFAGGKTTDRREAYLIDVTRKGQVKASTRHTRGASLADLEIVKRALNDPADIAAQFPLIRYKDGTDTYLGVYTRKRDGGAVIVAYNLAKAQADMDTLGTTVKGSFANLVTITTDGTRQALAASTPRIKDEATRSAKETVALIDGESKRVSRVFADRMNRQAVETTRNSSQTMTRQADRLSQAVSTVMHARSQGIIQRAQAEMAPIGKQSIEQAVKAMAPQAELSVSRMKAQLQPQIKAASEEAAGKIQPEAEKALTSSRLASLLIGLAVLIVAAGLGLWVSYLLSRRIADPIEVEKQLKEAELSRFGKEMEIATRIQTALIPTKLDVEDYDLSMCLVTATEVGGDLIDYIPQADGNFWLAVGDVTGHGLTPGLIMMMAQSILTGLVLDAPHASPTDMLVRLNHALYQNVKFRLANDNYMTLQLIRHLGDGKFVGAGMHCDYLIYRAETGDVERYETPGFWTGLVPDVREMTEDYWFELGSKDVLLLYTDGLIECMDTAGEQYDMDRLEATLKRLGHLSAREIEAALLAEVQAWLHEQRDDISIAVLKRHEVPVPHRQPALV
ncbi:MAG: SpoIIE family protein phosphatase [Candidatus Sericytochromatia bacterium]|nr:SpoIIE family protein phosphatase [Candidatus Sericytochromatia bacterium]